MIVDQDRQSLHACIKAWPFREHPTFENVAVLQSKVKVEAGSVMPFYDEAPRRLISAMPSHYVISRIKNFLFFGSNHHHGA
jgi:hypothetical protein